MQTHSKLLTITEAAEQLSVKPKTLRAWIAARRISVVRPMGWALRIPASEVTRIVEEGTIAAVEGRQ
ncbi:MAG: helix-turn-helix domain-containing protein [Silvibacterium sp.]